MIKLSNVSKYYHNEGIVTLALHKIDLEFKSGEFVAITGESGSGKSTLLNVIAGIDTYEEGELYINGEETSYFDDEDWENYRKNKIAFIFQNYNLIDSYTVLKNVEAALVVQGLSSKERVSKAKEIIDKVGLSTHLKHRASKLSGGQKQRLAIARALAKETDVIVADEPTGNLDSVSGKQVIELLSEIAKDKLVFIVTHNYEQVDGYVSRKIRLFDGEIVEDRMLRKTEEVVSIEKNIEPINELNQALTLAKFNFFSQPKKSVFTFLVCLAIVFFIFLFYSFMITPPTNSGSYDLNALNNYKERLILVRKDRDYFTDSDFEFLNNHSKIDKVIKHDRILDKYLELGFRDSDFYLYFSGLVQFDIKYDDTTLIGRLPTEDDEILLNIYYSDDERENILNSLIDKEITFTFRTDYYKDDVGFDLKIVGVNKRSAESKDGYMVTDTTLERMYQDYLLNNQHTTIIIEPVSGSNTYFDAYIKTDDDLTGNDVILENIPNFGPLKSAKIVGKEVNVVGYTEYAYIPLIYASREFMQENFPFVYKQITVNLKNVNDRTSLEKELNEKGFYVFSPLYDYKDIDFYGSFNAIGSIFTSIGFVFIMFILYLISYLIFKLVMNTKIKDYTILRIIGARKTLISNIIRSELLISFLASYIIFFITYMFIKVKYPFLENLNFLDYIIVFLLNIALSLLIARRFIKKQVQKSLYTNLRVE